MSLRRCYLPIGTFILVWLFHYIWLLTFPEVLPAQDQWVSFDDSLNVSVWSRYLASQSYYLSYTYAVCLAFASVQYRRYREMKTCPTGKVALFGSVGFSGVLSIGSCFLLGCCGSPMLGVYLSLLGANIMPLAKPIIAGASTLILFGSWIWIRRNESLKQNTALTTVDCKCE